MQKLHTLLVQGWPNEQHEEANVALTFNMKLQEFMATAT